MARPRRAGWRTTWRAGPVAAMLVLATLLPFGGQTPVLARGPQTCQPRLFAASASASTSASSAQDCVVLETGTVAATLDSLPTGFTESVVFTGLVNPTNIEFAADGRVFVAEKSGVLKVYDNIDDQTPTAFSDLTTNVHNYWDRGLLGLALDPSLTDPTLPPRPWVYVLYAYDHVLGGTGPVGSRNDGCPSPPGPTTDGCVVSGRLSRFNVSGTTISGPETVLVEDWCQQFPSHSLGDLGFGPDGALYASAGDGASFTTTDYGQLGGSQPLTPTPKNPCGDPPADGMTPPTAEGGALRSQDVRTDGDPATLAGSIVRVDPVTGAAFAGNPFAASPDLNKRRIIAHGLRNPFRFQIRPGTNELWVGDVGYSTWEEIDRIADIGAGAADNFGWPCYEGTPRQSGYDNLDLTLCETLYGAGTSAVAAPIYAYNHSVNVVTGETCPTGGSAIAGMAFYPETGGNFPAAYRGGLFFADHNRDCIWWMAKGADGQPDPATRAVFLAPAANPVDLEIGPDGALYYADFDTNTIRKVSYAAGNQPPTAVARANPSSGTAPLTVAFDATGSSDPEGALLTYAWDLDGDGQYDDSASATPTWVYSTQASVTARLRVTDPGASSATDSLVISVSNTAPVPVIQTPSAGTKAAVGQQVTFSGSASDAQDGSIPASRLSWQLRVQHCPSNCHSHDIETFPGVASGAFGAPDHDYPSYLELILTATDSNGVSASVTRRIDPKTVDLSFKTVPSGLAVTVNGTVSTAPFTRTVIQGSVNSVTATTPQTVGSTVYDFGSWSDGGARTHGITPTASQSSTATYTAVDNDAPAGTVSIAGGAAFTKTTAVVVQTPGTDTTPGTAGTTTPATVSTRIDGGSWLSRPYSPSVALTLPSANGPHTVSAMWTDAAGNDSAVKSDSIVLDTVKPAAGAPRQGLVSGTAIDAGRITVRVPWAAAADATSGIARYQLQQSTDGGSWVTVSSTLTSPTINRLLATLHGYAFRARAVDKAGNVGAWATGTTFRVSRFSESNSAITYRGSWTTVASSRYWGGAAKKSTSPGTTAALRFSGRSIAWVARPGPDRGKADVYVNGTKVASVDLYSTSYLDQRVVWVHSWSTVTARTITIRVAGSAPRVRVDLDALVTAN